MEAEIEQMPKGKYQGEALVYYDGKNKDKRY